MENKSYLSVAGNNQAQMLLQLQNWLFNLTDENFEITLKNILNSVFVVQENHQKELVHTVMNTLVYRPLNAHILAKFVHELLLNEKTKETDLKQLFLSKLSAPAFSDLSHLVFYRKLLDLQTYPAEVIVNQIVFFFFNFPPAQITHIILFAWFTPEIEMHNPEHFNRILELVSSSEIIQSRPDIVHFFKNLELFKQNEYSLWHECMRTNDQPDSLTYIIRNDDIEALESYISAKEDFDINQRIPPFIFGVSTFLTCFPTLIEYACFVGALKCVTYLIENGADVTIQDLVHTTIAQFAVAGGNLEILRLLEKNDKVSFLDCISSAVRFFRNDIFDWLIKEKYPHSLFKMDTKDLCTLHYAAESGNVSVLLKCLDDPNADVNIGFRSGWTPLHIASKYGQFPMIKILTQHEKIKINQIDARGWTALHWAANNCHPESVRILLLNQEIDINALDNEGQSALHWAATKGYPDTVRVLLAHKETINVNIRNNDGSTPLHMAAMRGNLSAVNELVSFEGIDINIKDFSEATPLYVACENGQVEVVQVLVNCFGIDVNQPDSYGETPLFAACSPNNPRKKETIEALLKHSNININAVNQRSATPLHILAENGDKESCALLLSRPDLQHDAKDNYLWTPLHSASSVGNNETLEALLDSGFYDVNAPDLSEKTALFWAIAAARSDTESGNPLLCVKLLLPSSNINHKNTDGQTCIHFAMSIFNKEIIEELLSSDDIDINKQDNDGNTPLHIAIREKNEDAVELLLKRSDIIFSLTNSAGQTPLHYAALSGTAKILKAILAIDASAINDRDGSSKTPLLLAVDSGDPEKVQALIEVPGININLSDGTGRSPRVNALLKGHAQIAQILAKVRPTVV